LPATWEGFQTTKGGRAGCSGMIRRGEGDGAPGLADPARFVGVPPSALCMICLGGEEREVEWGG
jgi:hypothetical protein